MTDAELAIYIGEKIKEYRKLKGLTQKDLAEKIGMGDTTIANYEKGFRTPKKNTLFKLANAFDISIDDLFPPIHSPSAATPASDTARAISETVERLEEPRRVIVLDTAKTQLREQKRAQTELPEPIRLYSYDYYDQPASAGTGQYLNEVPVEQIELPVDIDADFVVPIYGDSMEPEYHSGDYVFIRLSVDLSDGDIGVFEYYGDAYIKQLIINEDGAFLHSFNSDYDDIPIDSNSDFRIIGEVVGNFVPLDL